MAGNQEEKEPHPNAPVEGDPLKIGTTDRDPSSKPPFPSVPVRSKRSRSRAGLSHEAAVLPPQLPDLQKHLPHRQLLRPENPPCRPPRARAVFAAAFRSFFTGIHPHIFKGGKGVGGLRFFLNSTSLPKGSGGWGSGAQFHLWVGRIAHQKWRSPGIEIPPPHIPRLRGWDGDKRSWARKDLAVAVGILTKHAANLLQQFQGLK